MPEKQKHGFYFEKLMIEKYKLNTNNCNYTSEFDAYSPTGIPVQIKTYKKGNEIDFSDLKRNYEKKENFYLIISEWSSDYKFDNEKIFFFNYNIWKNFFNYDIKEMYRFISNISNDSCDDKKWKEGINKFKTLTKESIIKPRFKRDHKSQKRIQCAVSAKDINLFESAGKKVNEIR